MATKWSTPGIGYKEIDNTIRPNADPGDGIGAIVINANRGVPNQRVLCTTIDKFHEQFGKPDQPDQYGHFAAQVYFDQGGATQLLAVRATMGDEGYAQIQYPYTDSVDKNNVDGIQTLEFVDNTLLDNARLISKDIFDYIQPEAAKPEGFDTLDNADSATCFSYYGKSKVVSVQDVYDVFNGNTMENVYVFRDRTWSGGETGIEAGKMVELPVNDDEKKISRQMFAMSESDFTEMDVEKVAKPSDGDPTSGWYYQDLKDMYVDPDNSTSAYRTLVSIPASVSYTNSNETFEFYTTSADGNKSYSELVKDCSDVNVEPVTHVEIVDWDDTLTKTFTIMTSEWENAKEVHGLSFTEQGQSDSKYVLVRNLKEDKDGVQMYEFIPLGGKSTDDSDVRYIADLYAMDPSEICNENYGILKYRLAKDTDEEEPITVLVTRNNSVYENGFYTDFEYTWTMFLELNTKKVQIYSSYGVNAPIAIVKPWQVTFDKDENGEDQVNKLVAISSTEVFSDPTGIWRDGYTPSCETDAEPGNGDIELYQSSMTNQLIIGAIGPGEFGNDIGISIITPEAAKYPALYNTNAFSWLWRYDDEDKIRDSKSGGLDYRVNPLNLTWKKVYKINVYQKAPSKTEAVWGFGLDALTSAPVESWLVSNDPTAKDENGNSLWAPYVINGNSQFIYVSKKSVEQSINYKGEYCMPAMTWSIYQMTGGTNSKLNNIKEKTRALDLYTNRKKARFDYLFNVEPIETFSGKQKYMAMQNRIGQIAMKRKMDLGIIQCTSKEAKTIRLKLSEGKMFSFADGTYVAGYDDYDRYFDPFTSNWVMLPRSVAGAVACCFVDTFMHPWDSPAGVTQGRIAYCNRPMVNLEDDEFGQLYDIHINGSMHFDGFGECIMGQKTMLKKESALNRIDIRKLCNFIEKRLETKLVPYLYQKNTSTVRSSMRTAVDTFIGRIQTAGGIISRNVEVVPDENDTHLVYVNISFVPAEAIERIEVTLILNRQSGSITPVESTRPLT
jgi:hypothetical protein